MATCCRWLVFTDDKYSLMAKKSYEMGYTIAEFSKTLHGQFLTKAASYSCQDVSSTQWKFSVADKLKVDIYISEESPRVIAMLSLPVLNVEFTFNEGNEDLEQQALFLKRFFKYFHKGGG